jgi:2,3-dihydro-2,3-dihydroxybenzoate dehydrogenase
MSMNADVRFPFPPGVAVVTGAAQGIGAAVAGALARAGVPVALLDVQAAALHRQAEALQAAGARVQAWPLDLVDSAAVAAAVEAIERDFGPVGMLAHVAGVLRLGSATATREEDWHHCFAVNTHALFHLARAVAPRMTERRSGSIVAVGSNAALVPRVGMAAYAASKAAAHQFLRCLGLELAGSGVRCNLVAPGSTDTAMQRQLWTDPQAAQRVVTGSLAQYRAGIPLQRLAAPDDVAAAVLFLLSDAARHVTLDTLVVDGGATLGV